MLSKILRWAGHFHCCCLVAQSCLTLGDPMDCSMPGFPVLYCLPEFAQTHVHRVHDAIQPSHPLTPSLPTAFSLSQHQGVFKWVSSSHQVDKVLQFQLQYQSCSEYSGLIYFRIDWLDLLMSKGLSRVFSSIMFWKHQFFSAQPSLWSNSHIHTRKNHCLDYIKPLSAKQCLLLLICCLGFS